MEQEKLKKNLTSRIYGNQKINSRRRKHNAPNYTSKELRKWIFEQKTFEKLFENWVKSEYNKKERISVDRIDDSKGYDFENIRLTTWELNDKRGKEEHKSKNHPKAKKKKHYAEKAVLKQHFKKVCKSQGWDFKTFDEIESKEKAGTNKKYYYNFIGGTKNGI